jgi:hypothetical protein
MTTGDLEHDAAICVRTKDGALYAEMLARYGKIAAKAAIAKAQEEAP